MSDGIRNFFSSVGTSHILLLSFWEGDVITEETKAYSYVTVTAIVTVKTEKSQPIY